MKLNKGWTVIAALVLVLSLLAGCGSSSGSSGASGAGSTTGSAASPSAAAASPSAVPSLPSSSATPAAAQVTLKLFTWGTEEQYNWSKTIAAFEQKYPNIKIQLEQLSAKGDTQEYMKKLDLAAASGESMDILMFSDPAGYAQHVGMGMVAPLDSYIAKDGYDEAEEYKVDTTLNGKIYALPGKFNPWYVLLNKTMLDQANLPVPTSWTWSDFENYAQKLTHGEGANKVYGTYFNGPTNGGWMEYVKLMVMNRKENPDLLKADGSSNILDPNFKSTLLLRQRMEEAGTVVPYQDTIAQKLNYRDEFFNQKAAMIAIGSWMNTMLGGNDQYPLNFNVAVAPFPKNNPDDDGGYSEVTTDYVSVAQSSKYKQEAYDFVRWYTTEGQIVQGKNVPSWNKVSKDDLTKIIDTILSGTNNPEKVNEGSLIYTLSNSKSPELVPPVTYEAEVYKAVDTEFEKFILGQQDVDATVKNAEAQTEKIISANKK